VIARRRVTYCVWLSKGSDKSPQWLPFNQQTVDAARVEGCLFARKFRAKTVPLSQFLHLVYGDEMVPEASVTESEPVKRVLSSSELVMTEAHEDPRLPYRVHVATAATMSADRLVDLLTDALALTKTGDFALRHPDPLLQSATHCPSSQQGVRVDVSSRSDAERLWKAWNGLKCSVDGDDVTLVSAIRVSMDIIGVSEPVPLSREQWLQKRALYGWGTVDFKGLGKESGFLVVVCAGDGWMDLTGRAWLQEGGCLQISFFPVASAPVCWSE
jgi:hypothetical protein